jgi:ankyrin repeat protein
MPRERIHNIAAAQAKWKRRRLFFLSGVLVIAAIGSLILWRVIHVEPVFSKRTPSPQAAAALGDLNLLKELERQGISLDFQDTHLFDETPLIAAVLQGQTNVIEYLLEKRVNLNLRDRSGNTALMWAASTGGDTNIVKLLLEHGAQPSFKDAYGNSAYTVARGNTDMISLLKAYDEKGTNGRTN